MKITFIGTSHGVPAADRYCSCTMIESGNSVYFIDGGAPMIDELLRHGRHPDEVRAVSTHTFTATTRQEFTTLPILSIGITRSRRSICISRISPISTR